MSVMVLQKRGCLHTQTAELADKNHIHNSISTCGQCRRCRSFVHHQYTTCQHLSMKYVRHEIRGLSHQRLSRKRAAKLSSAHFAYTHIAQQLQPQSLSQYQAGSHGTLKGHNTGGEMTTLVIVSPSLAGGMKRMVTMSGLQRLCGDFSLDWKNIHKAVTVDNHRQLFMTNNQAHRERGGNRGYFPGAPMRL